MKKSQILPGIKETFFQLALLHFIIMIMQVIITGNITYLNLASILDLSFFYPSIRYTPENTLLFSIPFLILVLINILRLRKKGKD